MCWGIPDIAGMRCVSIIAWSASSIIVITEWRVHTGAMGGVHALAMVTVTDVPELRLQPRPTARRATLPGAVLPRIRQHQRGVGMFSLAELRRVRAGAAPGKPLSAPAVGNRCVKRETLGNDHGRNDRHNADVNQDGTDSSAAAQS